jgi:hypothetical protein
LRKGFLGSFQRALQAVGSAKVERATGVVHTKRAGRRVHGPLFVALSVGAVGDFP